MWLLHQGCMCHHRWVWLKVLYTLLALLFLCNVSICSLLSLNKMTWYQDVILDVIWYGSTAIQVVATPLSHKLCLLKCRLDTGHHPVLLQPAIRVVVSYWLLMAIGRVLFTNTQTEEVYGQQLDRYLTYLFGPSLIRSLRWRFVILQISLEQVWSALAYGYW